MASSVDPDQTAQKGAVCSGYTVFASILHSQLFAADDFSRRHFQMHFFLGALRVNIDVLTTNAYLPANTRSLISTSVLKRQNI